MAAVRFSRADAEEMRYKLDILACEPDLMADYGLTQDQADDLLASVPAGGGLWEIPDWAIPAVVGEAADITVVLHACADGAKFVDPLQARRIRAQADRFDGIL